MTKKQIPPRLDCIAPGWAAADRPAQYCKTIDPKHRQEAGNLLARLSNLPTPKKTKKQPAKG